MLDLRLRFESRGFRIVDLEAFHIALGFNGNRKLVAIENNGELILVENVVDPFMDKSCTVELFYEDLHVHYRITTTPPAIVMIICPGRMTAHLGIPAY